MDALKLIEQGSMKAEAPKIEIGDLVQLFTLRSRKARSSVSRQFEGTVIAKKHGGINETFTVRRASSRLRY